MKRKILLTTLLFVFFTSSFLLAQETVVNNQNIEKLRGTRFIPYPNYSGQPFLNDKFLLGEIELTDGTKIKPVGLNYSTYRDELVYYNTAISTQIQIDKISLKGFSFTDNFGKNRVFHRQFCSASIHDECFFEVLSDGDPALLVYRKVNLESCDTYYSKLGLAYQPAYIYFIYSAEKGYSPLNLNRNSLLSKFDKQDQKSIRKLLRKNGVFISNEASMVEAWNLTKEKDYRISF